jgi:hypothetical protein
LEGVSLGLAEGMPDGELLGAVVGKLEGLLEGFSLGLIERVADGTVVSRAAGNEGKVGVSGGPRENCVGLAVSPSTGGLVAGMFPWPSIPPSSSSQSSRKSTSV